MADGQDDFNKRSGAEMRADALHELIEYANTDPQHVAVAGCACFQYVGDNPQCPEHGKGSEAVPQP
jgi:hypothetical protein